MTEQEILALLDAPKSLEQLAEASGLSVLGVRLHILELTRKGLIRVAKVVPVKRAPSKLFYEVAKKTTAELAAARRAAAQHAEEEAILQGIEAYGYVIFVGLREQAFCGPVKLKAALLRLKTAGRITSHKVRNEVRYTMTEGHYSQIEVDAAISGSSIRTTFVEGKNPFR